MKVQGVIKRFLNNSKDVLLTLVNDTCKLVILLVKSQIDNLFLTLYNEECLCEFQLNLNNITSFEEEETQLVLNIPNGYITLEKA